MYTGEDSDNCAEGQDSCSYVKYYTCMYCWLICIVPDDVNSPPTPDPYSPPTSPNQCEFNFIKSHILSCMHLNTDSDINPPPTPDPYTPPTSSESPTPPSLRESSTPPTNTSTHMNFPLQMILLVASGLRSAPPFLLRTLSLLPLGQYVSSQMMQLLWTSSVSSGSLHSSFC